MKDEQHIDHIFNQGLNDSGMEYSDAHWEGMNSVLDQHLPASTFTVVNRIKLLIFGSALLVIGYFIGFNQANQNASAGALNSINEEQLNITEEQEKPLQLVSQSIEPNEESVAIKEATEQKQESYKLEEKKGQITKNTAGSTSSTRNPTKRASSPQPTASKEENKKQRNTSNDPVDASIYTFDDVEEGAIEVAVNKEEVGHILRPISFEPLGTLSNKPLDRKTFNVNHKSASPKGIENDLVLPNRNPWKFYVSPFIGYSVNSRSLAKSLNVGLKLAEIPENTFTYGLNASVRRKNWAVKSGIEINQYQERQEYISQNTSWTYDTTLKIVIKDYGTTGSGNRLALLDEIIDSTGTTQTSTCQDCKMSVSYISIPLSVQYLKQWRKFTIYGEVGVNYALRKTVSGEYSSLSDENRWVLTEAKTELKENWVGAKIGGGLMYKVTPKVNIFSGVETNRSLTSLTSSYTQQLQQTSFKAGVQVKVW